MTRETMRRLVLAGLAACVALLIVSMPTDAAPPSCSPSTIQGTPISGVNSACTQGYLQMDSNNALMVSLGSGGSVDTLDSCDMAVALGHPTQTTWASQTSTVISSSLAIKTTYRLICNADVNFAVSNGAQTASAADNDLAAKTSMCFTTGTAAQTNLTVYPSNAAGHCTLSALQATF